MPLNIYPSAVTIRIIRPNYNNNLSIDEKNDVTECNLDNYSDFKYTVINDENFEDSLRRCLHE